jgi:hypothetical protein
MNVYKLAENTLMERIRLHYLEEYEISEADKKILARWVTAHALLLDGNERDSNVVKILIKRFGISSVCAYNDVRNSKNLFGDVGNASKELMRYLVTQWAIDLFRMAKLSKNLDAMARAIERITMANNLDKQDQDIPDASKIQPPVQLLSINFTFINTPEFKLIDAATQKALLQLYDEVMAQIVITPLGVYSDMFAISESARPKKK